MPLTYFTKEANERLAQRADSYCAKLKKTKKSYYNPEQQKEYRQLNKERMRKYQKEYRNRPEVKAKRLAQRANPEYKKKKLEAKRKWANSPKGKATRKAYAQRPEVKKKNREYVRKYLQRPEIKAKQRAYYTKLNRQRRKLVLKNYGEACACCEENEPNFLAVDHISGKGSKHRKKLKEQGIALYTWLIKHNYPPGFQLLCHNCNMAKGFYGKCPHEVERNARIQSRR